MILGRKLTVARERLWGRSDIGERMNLRKGSQDDDVALFPDEPQGIRRVVEIFEISFVKNHHDLRGHFFHETIQRLLPNERAGRIVRVGNEDDAGAPCNRPPDGLEIETVLTCEQVKTDNAKWFSETFKERATSIFFPILSPDAKRVLFLVDTRNLGEQAEQEMMSYVPLDDNRKFTELYTVQRLKSSFVATDSQVCIST